MKCSKSDEYDYMSTK